MLTMSDQHGGRQSRDWSWHIPYDPVGQRALAKELLWIHCDMREQKMEDKNRRSQEALKTSLSKIGED